MRRVFAGLLAAATLLMTLSGVASLQAQDFRRDEPGKFDYYVLVLSWSPSYCAGSRDRFSTRPDPQCEGRPFSFVVHGLWPQYERGFPEDCQVPAPRLSRNIVGSMLDLMPSPRLVYHEWDRHGTCSGLGQGAYFDTIRKAREAVKIPPDYLNLNSPLTVAPDDVANSFVAWILACPMTASRCHAAAGA